MKKIVIDLSKPSTIDKAIKEVQEYKKWLTTKTAELVSLLTRNGATVASAKFAGAAYAGFNDVEVTSEIHSDGKRTVGTIRADGDAVLFIEFGTGITMPEAPAEELAITTPGIPGHGTYGQGQGANPKGWIYEGMQGVVVPNGTAESTVAPGKVRTFGNPASHSMFDTRQRLIDDFDKYVQEVFGK